MQHLRWNLRFFEMNRQSWKLKKDVEQTEIDGTLVLLDRTRGVYLGVNAVGTQILGLLVEGKDAGQIVTALSLRYGAAKTRLREDVEAFMDALRERGLLEPAPPGPATDAP